jgi:hypothetical protein
VAIERKNDLLGPKSQYGWYLRRHFDNSQYEIINEKAQKDIISLYIRPKDDELTMFGKAIAFVGSLM